MSENNLEKKYQSLHIYDDELKIIKYLEKLKENLFLLYYSLLIQYEPSIYYESISIILQYLQFLYFSFDHYVSLINKKF
jgi:hypothetical protein